MKGYKAFDKDLKCRGLQYEVGKTVKIKGEIELCKNGLHFCKNLKDVFNYYPKSKDTRVCEVESSDNVLTENDKSVTDSITILRELSREEIDSLTDNLRFNSGYYNSGHRNSGDSNSGSYNSGDSNSGSYNSGYYNSGDSNSGSYNSGNCNSGDCNSGNYNSGFFNTNEPTVRMFNKDTNIKRKDLPDLSFIANNWKPHLEYVNSSAMTEQEKEDHPYHVTTGGFIRKDTKYSYKKSWERVWSKITEEQKNIIKSLPNFCPDIFKEITGIDVTMDDKITVIVNGVEKQILKTKAKELGLI